MADNAPPEVTTLLERINNNKAPAKDTLAPGYATTEGINNSINAVMNRVAQNDYETAVNAPQGATAGQTALAPVGAISQLVSMGTDTLSKGWRYEKNRALGKLPTLPEKMGEEYLTRMGPEVRKQLEAKYEREMDEYDKALGEYVTPVNAKAGPMQRVYEKIPYLEEAVAAAESDTALTGNSLGQKVQSIFNIIGVHGTRAATLAIPGFNLVGAAGFFKLGVGEVEDSIKNQVYDAIAPAYDKYLEDNDLKNSDEIYQNFLKEQGVDMSDHALAAYVGLGGLVHGAIEYSQASLMLGGMQGKVLKVLSRKWMNKLIFGKLGPRAAVFLASQAGRAAMEAGEEAGQERTAIGAANLFIEETNVKREEMGLPALNYVSEQDTADRVKKAAIEGGKAAFITGLGPGGIVASNKESRLRKAKALRLEMQDVRKRIYLEHEKVSSTMEMAGNAAEAQVTEELQEALNGAEEGDLWVRARELQEESMLEGDIAQIEDSPGDTMREKLVNYILERSKTNDDFISRYTSVLEEILEEDNSLGAADKLFIKLGILNDNMTDEDLLALRKVLDGAARNLVDENGTPKFKDINEAAEDLIDNLKKKGDVTTYRQAAGTFVNDISSFWDTYSKESPERVAQAKDRVRELYENNDFAAIAKEFPIPRHLQKSFDKAKQSHLDYLAARDPSRFQQDEILSLNKDSEEVMIVGSNNKRNRKMTGEKMYGVSIAETTAKELFQNSVDTLMTQAKYGKPRRMFHGHVGTEGHSMYLSDEGTGMSAKEIVMNFLPAYQSGKAEGEGGGFGYAKMAFLGGSKGFMMRTAKEIGPGEYEISTLFGSGEAWDDFADLKESRTLTPDTDIELVPGLTLRYTRIKTKEPFTTGTTFVSQTGDSYNATSWMRNGAMYVPDIPVIRASVKEVDVRIESQKDFMTHPMNFVGDTEPVLDQMEPMYSGENTRVRKITTLHVPGATIDVVTYNPKDEPEGATEVRSYLFVPILNRSILQFTKTQRFQNDTEIPKGLAFNVKATGKAEEGNYPFTLDRKQLTEKASEAIDAYLNDIQKEQHKIRLEKYKKAKTHAPKMGNGRSFLDISTGVPQALVEEYMTDPSVITLERHVGDAAQLILAAMQRKFPQSALFGRATYEGLIVNAGAFGVHFGKEDVVEPSTIYIDIGATMRRSIEDIQEENTFNAAEELTPQEFGEKVDAMAYELQQKVGGLGDIQFAEIVADAIVNLKEPTYDKVLEELDNAYNFYQEMLEKSALPADADNNLVIKEWEEKQLAKEVKEKWPALLEWLASTKGRNQLEAVIGTQFVVPENIWTTEEASQVEVDVPLTNEQKVIMRFFERIAGTLVHEGVHQKVGEHGEAFASLLTTMTGVLSDTILQTMPEVMEMGTAEQMVNRLGELYDKVHKYEDTKVADKFITAQGEYESYSSRDPGSTERHRAIEAARSEAVREDSKPSSGPVDIVSSEDSARTIAKKYGLTYSGMFDGKKYGADNVYTFKVPVGKTQTVEAEDSEGRDFEGDGFTVAEGQSFQEAFDTYLSKQSPEQKEAVMALQQLGDTLRGGSRVIKGQTSFAADGLAYLEFFKSADISTVAHEFMHIFNRHMTKTQVGVSQVAYINSAFKDMDAKSKRDFLTKLEKYWTMFLADPTDPKIQKGEADQLVRGYMEFTARQFEKYLMNGIAPTKAMTTAFRMVKKAMKEVYGTISDVPDIRQDLDPAAKAVFDSLIAGDRYLKTPVPRAVYIEGNPYTVFVSRASDDIAKVLLKKLREGYSDVQGIHAQLERYATQLLGEKRLKKDAELKLRISKAGTFAEAKAVIDYVDRQLLTLQRKYKDELINEIKTIVKGVEWKKIDAKLASRIKEQIEGIDLKKLTPKKLNSLIGMRNWLSTNIQKGIITEDMTNISTDKLAELTRLAQKNIYDFDVNELTTLKDALTTIIQQGEKVQFLRIKKRIYYLTTEHDKLLESVKKLKPKDKYSGLDPDPNKPTLDDARKGLLKGIRHMIKVGGRQPHRLLLYIAEFDKTNPLYNFVNMIREGTRTVAERDANDQKWMRNLLISIGGAKNWSKKLLPEDELLDRRYLSYHKMTDSLGREVELPLTKAERISIYLYSLNEDARRHLVEGGIIMPQLKGTGIKYNLTKEGLAEIISQMDVDEKYVAHEMMSYYEEQVKDAINKVSVNLIGYGIARVDNYFPIYAEGKSRGNSEVLNKPALSKNIQQFQRKLIDRQNFLRDRTQSPSPLYIHDAFYAMKKNLLDVNRYVGLAEPLNYVKALFRDQQDPQGVYYSIARSWGPDAVQTIDEWIDRIEDPSARDEVADNFLRFIKRTSVSAQLGANMFVSMFQRVSLILAANYGISPASIGQAIGRNSTPGTGFGIAPNHSMADMAKIHPRLAPRFEVGPNIDVHELFLDSSTRHTWNKPTTAMQDIKRVRNWKTFKTAMTTLSVTSSMQFIKDNDSWALSTIWDAVQIQGQKEGWTEDQMKEKFMQIYYNTQPQYDVENISLMMSTKNPLSRIAFATYQTMPNQIWNEIEYHVREWGLDQKKPKTEREKNLSTIKMIGKVTNALVVQQLLINMIRELRNIGRDDDDEGIPYFGGVFLGTLKSMITTIPYIGGMTAGMIDAFADPQNRYNAFDTPGSFVSQLYTGSVVEGVEMYQNLSDGELAAAAYNGLRLMTKLLGITRGYSWDTIIGQAESVTKQVIGE